MIKCSAVSTTPKINPCHRFSVIAGVVDTSDKFIASDKDMGEQLSAVSLTLVINLSPITMISAMHNCSLVST
jgi:hypothetical protein